MSHQPIVMISSYPPRLCGIGTFTEEARELSQKANPEREVLVMSHTDGQGEGVLPHLHEVVSWTVVVQRYNVAYELAREAKQTGRPAILEPEF